MFLVAVWVMVAKTALVRRIDRGNNALLQAFRATPQVPQAGGAQQHPGASLARLYDTGVTQFNARKIGQPDTPSVSGATINALTAAVGADLVRDF